MTPSAKTDIGIMPISKMTARITLMIFPVIFMPDLLVIMMVSVWFKNGIFIHIQYITRSE